MGAEIVGVRVEVEEGMSETGGPGSRSRVLYTEREERQTEL